MKGLARVLLGGMPWLIIGILLLAAVYIKPGRVQKISHSTVITAHDRFYDVAFVKPDSFWMVGNVGKIVYSGDGGKTWRNQDAPTAEDLQSIAAWDANTLVAVGNDGVVLRTDDGGQTWQEIKAPLSGIADRFLQVRVANDGSAWLVGEYGAILVSRDRGKTWQRAAPPRDVVLHGVEARDGKVWVVGEAGTMLLSDDNGQTWHATKLATTTTLNAVCFRDLEHGVAVGLEGTVLVTDDGGQTWRQPPVVTSEHLQAVQWSGKEWMAVGNKGVLLTADSAADVWHATQVAQDSYAWHTGLVYSPHGWLLAGATVGFYQNNGWQPISTSYEEKP